MMRRLVLAILLVAMPAAAQRSVIPEENLIAARELAEAMGTSTRFSRTLAQIETRMNVISELRYRDRAFGAVSITNMQRLLDEVIYPAIIAKNNEVIDIFVDLHARRLTVEQMRYAASFYSTPTGQQLRMLETELNQTMNTLISNWLVRTIGETIVEQREALASRGVIISSERTTPR
ncbi:MAG: DUF2059 domain-containing protein [Roseomonas sp.]|nr:DUF2059 domain-containing protein [Roseomonas sp.]